MKKTVTIFILILFVCGLFGYYIPFTIMRSVIRSEMNERTQDYKNSNALVKLTFSTSQKNANLRWTRKGKEFEYNNEMYDVVKVIFQKNKVTYYCLHDKNEKELMEVFDTLIKKDDKTNKTLFVNSLKKLSKYNFDSNNSLIPVYTENIFKFLKADLYQDLYSEVNPPPPKFA